MGNCVNDESTKYLETRNTWSSICKKIKIKIDNLISSYFLRRLTK